MDYLLSDNTYQLTGVTTKWQDLEAHADATHFVTAGVTKTVTVNYDPMGNRTGYQETYTGGLPGLNKGYSHDPANGMTNDGGISQTLDNNGNLTVKGSETLTWDARNRLIGVQDPGQDNWSAVYDYNNRMAGKTIGVTQTVQIYDDLGRLWAETDSSGNPLHIYSYDAVGLIGQAEPRGNKLDQTYSLFDGLGSLQMVTDRSNGVVASYATDAFGVPSVSPNYDTPFRYTGRFGGYTDPRTGVVTNWNRGYSPEPGRWLSRDPIGVSGGHNLYCYVDNAFPSDYDPTGFCVKCVTKMMQVTGYSVHNKAGSDSYYYNKRKWPYKPEGHVGPHTVAVANSKNQPYPYGSVVTVYDDDGNPIYDGVVHDTGAGWDSNHGDVAPDDWIDVWVDTADEANKKFGRPGKGKLNRRVRICWDE